MKVKQNFKHLITVCIALSLILWLCCVLMCKESGVEQLNESEFKLSPFRYTLVKIGFGEERNIDAVKITTDGSIWIDRAEIPELLRKEGVSLWHCDWNLIYIEVNKGGDRIEFIKRIAPKLTELSKTL